MANKATNRTINIWINNKEVENKFGSINRAMRAAKNQLAGMEVGSKKYHEQVLKIKELDKHIQRHKNQIKSTISAWQRMKNEVKAVAGGNLIASGLQMFLGGIAQAFKFITKSSGEAEQGLTNVLTLLSSDDAVRYKETLKETSAEITRMGFAQEDTNKALFDAISAGTDAADANVFLAEAAVLAKGGVTKLGVAVDGMTTIQNAYNLSAEESVNVADAFFSTQKEGKTTVEELSLSIGKAAPIAASLGVKYQELMAASARITLTGTKTSEAMTQLKAVFSNLMKPGTDATKVMTELGIPMGVTQVKAAGFTNVLAKLNDVVKDSPDLLARIIPSVEGQNAVLALSNEGFESYSDILQKVQGDIGVNSSLQRAYNEQMQTLPNIMAAATGEFTAMAVQVGDHLTPIIKMLLPFITSLKKRIVQLAAWVQRNADAIITYVRAINPLLSILYELIDTSGDATEAQKTFSEEIAEGTIQQKAMFTALKNTTKGTESHRVAIDNINKEYGKYLPNLLTEKSTLEEINAAQLLANKALISNIALKRKSKETEDVIISRLDKEKSIIEQLKALAPNKANQSVIMAKFQEAVGAFETWNELLGTTVEGRQQVFGHQIDLIEREFTKPFNISNAAVRNLAEQMANLRGQEKTAIDEINDLYDGYIITLDGVKKKKEDTGAVDVFGSGSGGGKKALDLYKKYIKEWEKLNTEVIDARRMLGVEGESAEEKEIIATQNHYNDMLEVVSSAIAEFEKKAATKKGLNDKELGLLNQFNQQVTDLELLREEKLRQIREKFAKERIEAKKKLQDKIDDVLLSDKSKEVKVANEKYKALIAEAEKYGIDTVELYEALRIKLEEIDIKFTPEGEVKDFFGFTESDYQKLEEKFAKIAESLNAVSDTWSAFNDFRSAQEDAEMQKFEDNSDRKKAKLQEQLDQGLISQRNHDLRVADLERNLDNKKRQIAHNEAVRDKAQGIFQASINTAVAITKVLGNPFLVALAAATGGFQIGAIAAQPIPAYADGGRINTPHLGIVGEEGPEIILSNKTLNDPVLGPLADDLARIQEGKQPNFLNQPQKPNFAKINEAIKPNAGGFGGSKTIINQVDSKGMQNLADQVAMMAKSIENIEYLKAVITQRQLDERDDEEELLNKLSTI